MSAMGARLTFGIFLLVVMLLLTGFPAGNPFARLGIIVLTMAVVVVLTLAAQADRAERRAEPEPATVPPATPPAQPATSLTGPRISTPPTRRPPPDYHLTQAPRAGSVPRFGRGSKASQVPWRLPTPPSPVQGIVADEAELGGLSVRAASLVGPGHRCAEPAGVRQDAYRLGRDATGDHLVVAVADGVSNSPRADLGAMVAVSSVVTSIVDLLRTGRTPDQLSAPELFARVAGRIQDEAAGRGLSAADVCTVLIVAVLPAKLADEGPKPFWVGWIGDASLWQLSDGRWRMAAGNRKRDQDGFASNALDAVLPADPHAAQSTLLTLAPGDALTLVTDGVGDGLAGLPAFNGFLAKEWATPPPIADFINHVGYDAEQFTDDRSAVTVWARGTAPATRSRWSR